jgi:hypothetical protein
MSIYSTKESVSFYSHSDVRHKIMESGLVFHCLVSIFIVLFEAQLLIIMECKLACNECAGVCLPHSRHLYAFHKKLSRAPRNIKRLKSLDAPNGDLSVRNTQIAG